MDSDNSKRNLTGSAFLIVPTVSHLGGNPGVAGLAECHEVALGMAAAVAQRDDVVDLLGPCEPSLFQAELAERVLRDVHVPDPRPPATVPPLLFLAASVSFISLVGQLLMFLTVTSFGQLRAAGPGAGTFWFPGHCVHLPMKKPGAFAPGLFVTI